MAGSRAHWTAREVVLVVVLGCWRRRRWWRWRRGGGGGGAGGWAGAARHGVSRTRLETEQQLRQPQGGARAGRLAGPPASRAYSRKGAPSASRSSTSRRCVMGPNRCWRGREGRAGGGRVVVCGDGDGGAGVRAQPARPPCSARPALLPRPARLAAPPGPAPPAVALQPAILQPRPRPAAAPHTTTTTTTPRPPPPARAAHLAHLVQRLGALQLARPRVPGRRAVPPGDDDQLLGGLEVAERGRGLKAWRSLGDALQLLEQRQHGALPAGDDGALGDDGHRHLARC